MQTRLGEGGTRADLHKKYNTKVPQDEGVNQRNFREEGDPGLSQGACFRIVVVVYYTHETALPITHAQPVHIYARALPVALCNVETAGRSPAVLILGHILTTAKRGKSYTSISRIVILYSASTNFFFNLYTGVRTPFTSSITTTPFSL